LLPVLGIPLAKLFKVSFLDREASAFFKKEIEKAINSRDSNKKVPSLCKVSNTKKQSAK
jgi:hypothetical protein